MRQLLCFLLVNKNPFGGMLIGGVAGLIYWQLIGFQWGTYPLSSECWVNCIYGSLFGGLIGSLLDS